jgi:LPS sulfotransferase NodH
MSEVHCFTSASFAYLDRVCVLVETLRRHNPDWIFWLCLVDSEPPGFTIDLTREGVDHVVRIEELDIADRDAWMFKHDVVELCTAVKGIMLCKLLEQGISKVVYIDPDIAVLDNLSEIDILLDKHDIILTPHLLEPELELGAISGNEIGSLKHGVYNLGFLAVAGTPEGKRFAKWWCDRLLHFCFDDIPNGLFTDQRWCDLVPCLFAGVHILRDPGYNVASWNLSRRPITIGEDGEIRAADRPLRFFHFTKITRVGEQMLERYSGGRIEVFELMNWYRKRLSAHAVKGLPEKWWHYGTYNDGTPITREHRRLYRDHKDLQRRFPNPFEAETAAALAGDDSIPKSFCCSYHGTIIEKYFIDKTGIFDPITLPKEIQSIFLCFTNRCGSTLVADEASALGFCGKANSHLNFELFNSDFVIEYCEANSIKSFQSYLDAVVQEFISPLNFFFSKASLDQLAWLSRVGVIGRAFKRPIYLRVVRKDILKQSVSYLIAEQTNKWTCKHNGNGRVPQYNREDIANAMSFFEGVNTDADLYFHRLKEKTIFFFYEDVVADLDLVRVKLEMATNVPSRRSHRVLDVKPQRSEINDEWERRFRAESDFGLQVDSLDRRS